MTALNSMKKKTLSSFKQRWTLLTCTKLSQLPHCLPQTIVIAIIYHLSPMKITEILTRLKCETEKQRKESGAKFSKKHTGEYNQATLLSSILSKRIFIFETETFSLHWCNLITVKIASRLWTGLSEVKTTINYRCIGLISVLTWSL